MKRFLSILFASAAIGLAAVPAEATLFDRGGGFIYDNDLNITWLQDANYAYTSGYDADGRMTWQNAMTWADTLGYGGYSDWRLPTVVPQNDVWGYDGTTGHGYNITIGSEMGHLHYAELGNKGLQATDGTVPQPGWSLNNISFNSGGPGGPIVSFTNQQFGQYWSGTEYAPNTSAWDFGFNGGLQNAAPKSSILYALAVRDGDVVASVPEPGTMLLLGSGLVGLVAFRKRFGL